MEAKTYEDCLVLAKRVHIHPTLIAEAYGIETQLDRQLKVATTLEELLNFYEYVPSGSEAEMKVLAKMLEIANTLDDLRNVYEYFPYGSEIESKVLLKMLEVVTTVEEARSIFCFFPEASEIQKQAIRVICKLSD